MANSNWIGLETANPHVWEKLLTSNLTCVLHRISWTIGHFSNHGQFSLSQLLFHGLKDHAATAYPCMVGSLGNGKTWNTTMICDCRIKLSTSRGGYMVITYSGST